MPDMHTPGPPPKIGPVQPQHAPRPTRSCCNSYDDQAHELGCQNRAALDREMLDALPVVPLLVYVDNQRNRYEFRTHLGTMQRLREMDPRDLAIVRALAEHLAQDALQIQLEEIERL